MSSDDIIARIRNTDISDEEGLESIASSIQLESWDDPRKVVQLLHGKGSEDFEKAAAVTLLLGDLIFTPVIESFDSENPDSAVWDIETIVDIQLTNRKRITALLYVLLEDTRSVMIPDMGEEEESYRPRRVCDESYLQLRRLTAMAEEEEDQMLNMKLFLEMNNDDRDAEIGRIKSSQEWTNLLDRLYG